MKFDTDKEGLHTLFRPYQALLLEHLWELNGESRVGVNSGARATDAFHIVTV